MTLRRRLTFFAASLPERLVRSTAAILGGTVHETAQLLLPRLARRSRLYEASAKNLLRILIEGVGAVEPLTPTTPDPNAPPPKQLAIRKGAGNIVELGSIAAFGFSPLWLLAAVADLTHGSRVYLHALTDDLKASGVIRDDVDVSSVDDLLGILEGTSGRTARLIDIPPVELAELRTSLRELHDEATDLPSQEQLGRLYDGLRRTAAAEDRSLLEVSQGIGMAFVTSARTISDRHVKVPYREDWEPLRDEGFAAYARRVSRPYGEAAASHFDPDRRSYTERALSRIPASADPESFEFCDELEQGFGWIAKEKLGRVLTRAQEPRRGLDLRSRPVAARARADRGARRAGRRRPAARPPRPRLRRGGLGARRPALRGARAGDRRLAARDRPGRALALLEGGRGVDPGAARPRRRRRARHRRLLPGSGRAARRPPAAPLQAAEDARPVRAEAHPLRPRDRDPRRGCARDAPGGAQNRAPPSPQGLARRRPPGLVKQPSLPL